MSSFLPFVMQQLCNRPLAVSDDHGRMIVAALSGRLNISSYEDQFTRLDAAEMSRIAAGGRATADAQRSAAKSQPATPKAGNNYTAYERVGSIAIIRVWGTLTRNWGVGPYSGSTGYDGIEIQLLDAIADPKVDAIWMDFNSGGGAVDGCFDLVDLIWNLNEKNGGKPIWGMAADHAYSAAYALMSACDKLWVPPTGGVGSIGVITLHADITAALDEAGIKVTVIRSKPRKAKENQFEALDQETYDHIQQQLMEIDEIFNDKVARNMGVSKKSVSETLGLDYMGARAKTIGLVSDVLSEHEAWAKLERKVARR